MSRRISIESDPSVNRHWRLTGGYRYVENDSSLTGYSYEDQQIRLALSLSY